MDCKDCVATHKPVNGIGGKHPKILFVGGSPAYQDMKQGQVFADVPGQVLQGILDTVEIPDEDVYFTMLFKCWLDGNRKPTASEMESCMPVLLQEAINLKPDYVIALGKEAAHKLFPKTSIYRDRGKLMDSVLGIPGTITFHPAAVLLPKGDTKLPFMISDVRKIWRHATGRGLPDEMTDPHTEVFLVQEDDDMWQLLDRLNGLPIGTLVSLDWETTGLTPVVSVPVCLGLSWAVGTGVAVEHWLVRKYASDLREALHNKALTGFNVAAFDYGFSKVLDLHGWFDHDAMMMHYALDERPQKRSQENLTVQDLDAPPYETELMTKYETTKKTFIEDVPVEDIMEYCAKDVDWALRLTLLYKEELERKPTLFNMYQKCLMPSAHVVGEIARTGLWVDKERLNVVSNDLSFQLDTLMNKMRSITGNEDFNPNSPMQVAAFVWDELMLEEPNLYGRKARSVNAETLGVLMAEHPDNEFITALAEYRKINVYYTRYVRGLEDKLDEHGRVHASIHVDRTETGRLSISNPPLHQIPREGIIRTIFAAPPGRKLIQADFAQLEIRIAAHVGQDKTLTALLRSGVDFHTKMASEAFRIPVEEVTKEQRQAAKAVSFGLLYLMSENKLANDTGLPPKQAKEFVKRYKALMPSVWKTIDETKRMVREDRRVDTIFGRRRRFHILTQKNVSGLEREAVNFRLGQSPGHDVTMNATVRLYHFLQEYYPEAKIVLTVHDSIMVECPDYIAKEIAAAMFVIMEADPFPTEVPFPVEIKIGQAWGTGYEVKRKDLGSLTHRMLLDWIPIKYLD